MALDQHPDYDYRWLEWLYQHEKNHFWFVARNEFIYSQLNKLIDKNANLLDIGSGTGSVDRFLLDKGYHSIAVGDIHMESREYAKSYGIEEFYQLDLMNKESLPRKSFDCISLFDVIEHIENTSQIFDSIRLVLAKDGFLVITVPAHEWLWSRDDQLAGHKCRYSKQSLRKLLETNDFEIISIKYFFIFIVPLLFLRRLLKPHSHKQIDEYEIAQQLDIHPWVNKILLSICRLEIILHAYLPNLFGGSLIVIARKK